MNSLIRFPSNLIHSLARRACISGFETESNFAMPGAFALSSESFNNSNRLPQSHLFLLRLAIGRRRAGGRLGILDVQHQPLLSRSILEMD